MGEIPQAEWRTDFPFLTLNTSLALTCNYPKVSILTDSILFFIWKLIYLYGFFLQNQCRLQAQKHIFCFILPVFSFFTLFMLKTWKKTYFNQHFALATPKRWSKYTTFGLSHFLPLFYYLILCCPARQKMLISGVEDILGQTRLLQKKNHFRPVWSELGP